MEKAFERESKFYKGSLIQIQLHYEVQYGQAVYVVIEKYGSSTVTAKMQHKKDQSGSFWSYKGTFRSNFREYVSGGAFLWYHFYVGDWDSFKCKRVVNKFLSQQKLKRCLCITEQADRIIQNWCHQN